MTLNPAMKLTCHRAMILTQACTRPSQQQFPSFQWRTTMLSKKSSAVSSPLQISFLASSPRSCLQLASCRAWLGRRKAGANPRVSQRRAASGTEEQHRLRHEELGRYGIDQSDYADWMTSPDRAQRHDSDEPHATLRSKNKPQKRKAQYEVVDRTREDPEDAEDFEESGNNDDGEGEGHDWCTYLILSSDKRKTYLGATANLSRRLKQHNGELAGGAKSVRGGRPWTLVCTIRGFGTRSEACQLEWRLRNISKGYLPVDESLFEEIPAHYQGLHIVLRRWAAFKKVHETMGDWEHMRVEWH